MNDAFSTAYPELNFVLGELVGNVQEALETITGWRQEILDEPQRYNNRFYQGFIVLNFCRMLHDL